jgi:hypothetical protein
MGSMDWDLEQGDGSGVLLGTHPRHLVAMNIMYRYCDSM